MAKKPTITTLTAGYQSTTTLNNNFTNLRNAFDNTLSLDGSTPNAMQADFDMNQNDILNANSITTDTLILDGVNMTVVQDVKLNIADITTVANSITDVNLVADNISGINNVSDAINNGDLINDVYQGAHAANPTVRLNSTPLQNGDIYFNTLSTRLRTYYNGSWYDSGSGGNTDAALVSYTSSGTGAVQRTTESKLRENMSVFDFMTSAQIADVKARTALVDVTVPLQAAIDAACTAKVQLFWPSGIYLISASLIAKSNANWKGEGGSNSIIKNNGTVRFMVDDDNTNMVDVTIDGLGFDYNGYNTLNFGTAMTFNGLSHTRFRIINNRVFDSNYPGDSTVLQRQGLFIGQNQDIWVLNNNFYHGARIKVGRGGHNVFIQSNKLFYINDNAITMAMDGRVATPNGDFTRNVHIEDNIIVNPSGNGIFLGADGEAEDDPAMFVKNVVVSRNIVYLDTPYTSDLLTPRFMQFIAPRGGVSDVLITDNVFVMTTNTPSTARECIRFNSPATPVGSFDRVSVTQNKFYTPYKTSTGVYVGVSHNTNDLVISNNEFDGVAEAIWMVNAPTHARPSITGNVIRNAVRGLRVDGNPVVTNGSFCDNRVVAPDAAIFFASTNAMEWTVQDNQIINSATDAIELRSAGTKNFYIIGNDLRGGTTGPIRLTSSAVLSTSSARYDNLGDAALPEVASAATVTVPYARVIVITGTTNIDNITTTGRAGQMITLIFGGVLTVNDGTGNLRLAGNFTTTTDDALTLVCTGNLWYEVARSAN